MFRLAAIAVVITVAVAPTTTRLSVTGAGGEHTGWLQGGGGALGSRKMDAKCGSSVAFWWFDEARPQAFSFFSLDDLYAAPYFKSDHIRTGVVNAIVDAQRKAYRLLSGRDLRSVAEFGGAGGWFTGKFAALGLDYQTVEGTQAGTEKIKQRPGVQPDRIHRADLRSPIELPPPHAGGKFDLAMNTEVAEHIEVPFHSQLVSTLTKHADLVWFSYAPPWKSEAGNEGNMPHVHHSAELPLRYWLNLFEFYGYGALKIDDADGRIFQWRGRLLLYRRATAQVQLPLLTGLGLARERVEHTVADMLLLPRLT